MNTDLANAVPSSVTLVSARKAVFTFDLNAEDNGFLRERSALDAGMALFLLKYERFEYYTAEYVGDWLIVNAHGTINLQ